MPRTPTAPGADAQEQPALVDETPSTLIRPTVVTPSIDLTRPEDAPDLPLGEWSRVHLNQFLARQPYSMVFIPKENWEPKDQDTFQTIGFQGHWFSVVKGKPVQVPIQIAAVIEQSQEPFPTMQSKAIRRQLTDISDLPQQAGSRGVPGVEVAV